MLDAAQTLMLSKGYPATTVDEVGELASVSKGIVADAVKATVEVASELVGGPGLSRGHPMERIARDVRAMHYHPLPVRRQKVFSGRL